LAAIGGYLFIVDITEKSIFNHLWVVFFVNDESLGGKTCF
jgi:hypothetical protein